MILLNKIIGTIIKTPLTKLFIIRKAMTFFDFSSTTNKCSIG